MLWELSTLIYSFCSLENRENEKYKIPSNNELKNLSYQYYYLLKSNHSYQLTKLHLNANFRSFRIQKICNYKKQDVRIISVSY
jgi:hypothetical protein